MSRPRVSYVIDDLGHGGAQRQLYFGMRALAGHAETDVIVLSEDVEPYASRIRALGAGVTVIPRRGTLDVMRALALTRRLPGLRTGIVHGMLESANAYAFLAARAHRIPTVLSLRSDRLTRTGARGRVLAWMMRNADAITVNSFAGKDYLVNVVGVRDDRVCYVPNIVDVPAAPREESPVPPVVGAVGRLVAMKRFGAIIDAMTAVRRSFPGARLVIVGDGPARTSLETLARREGVADAVEFTGAVDDAGAHLARFACLVVASTFEGLPNAALEALALGVPVVTVAAGDLPRVITDGVTGVIARDASPEALADALLRALTSETLRASAAHEGPRMMREEFSPARARDQLLKLYSRLSTAHQ